MNRQHSLSDLAALIADPTRAEMLLAMMDGRAFPASQLAAIAHVSPPTATHHLTKLVEGGLVEVFQSGRHRFHRLAGHEVADLIERMGSLQGRVPEAVRLTGRAALLSNCRTCYDHLAGRLAVDLRRSLEGRGAIVLDGDRYLATPEGDRLFKDFGIELGKGSGGRPLAKACLDWTERRPHIGSSLGRALLQNLLEKRWLDRGELPRSIRVTPLGVERLSAEFGIGIASSRELSAPENLQ